MTSITRYSGTTGLTIYTVPTSKIAKIIFSSGSRSNLNTSASDYPDAVYTYQTSYPNNCYRGASLTAGGIYLLWSSPTIANNSSCAVINTYGKNYEVAFRDNADSDQGGYQRNYPVLVEGETIVSSLSGGGAGNERLQYDFLVIEEDV